MLKGKSKKSSTTKTKKGKELSEKTMGEIVGGINGFDDSKYDDDAYECDVGDFVSRDVVDRENEVLEKSLRRFRRSTSYDEITTEFKNREHFNKPSVKRDGRAPEKRTRRKQCEGHTRRK